ncbi:hypothetical protein DIPPA_15959 [Diplonema papillatum]|nr:hypothetical protein DIPPA_15959 [Diplonema papillatum]
MPKVTEAYLAGLTVVELKALAVVVAGIQRKRVWQRKTGRRRARKTPMMATATRTKMTPTRRRVKHRHEQPVWRAPPPPTASEAASSFNWLRDPWLFYDSAHPRVCESAAGSDLLTSVSKRGVRCSLNDVSHQPLRDRASLVPRLFHLHLRQPLEDHPETRVL